MADATICDIMGTQSLSAGRLQAANLVHADACASWPITILAKCTCHSQVHILQ